MSEKSNPSLQKACDEALRALIVHGGLGPEQVSELKLSQVHLATGTLVIEPDEFAPSASASERPISLKLDDTMQRALIAWLVVRPDGPNDHLFPGTGMMGLDVASINQVIAAATMPSRAEHKKTVEEPPESLPRRTPSVRDGEPSPPLPPTTARRTEPEVVPPGAVPPEAVPLDEIESLRRRLAGSYDAWAPAVTSAQVRPVAEPAPARDVPPASPVETEPSAGTIDSEVPREPMRPPPREGKWRPVEARMSRPEKTPVARPEARPLGRPPEPDEVPAAEAATPPPGGVGEGLRGLLGSADKGVTLSLSYRAAAFGGLVLLVAICCIGLVLASDVIFGAGGLASIVAGATPTVTRSPTEIVPPVAFTPSPSPTPTFTVTSSPTPTPSASAVAPAAPAATPAPPPTVGSTPTPIVIVVTATPTPEPPATATPVPAATPVGGAEPEPTPAATPGFKYPAPVLLEPEDGAVVPGVIAILKWESVGPLADGEWYAVRLIFREQGELVYNGDRMKVTEWRVPDRFFYQADGPALEYNWYVFVERDNPDGSTTQLSPDSETFAFRWE
jgi:hypothetical protein